MKINLVSLYDARRAHEYPVQHSLHTMRLGAFIHDRRPTYPVVLTAFALDEADGAIASALVETGATVIGLPGYSWLIDKSRRIAKALLALDESILIVTGGPEATTFERHPESDKEIYVAGPGEHALLWLCDERQANPCFDGRQLPGDPPYPVYSRPGRSSELAAKLRKQVAEQRALPSLPHGVPLFSDAFMKLFATPPADDYAWFETARGCIYSCSFCGHNTLPYFATLNDELLAQEIANMQKRGIRGAFVNDPIFGGKPERGKHLLKVFQELAPDIRLRFYMRPEFLDDEYLEVMSRTNIQEVHVGLQTLNPKVPTHVRANRMDLIRRYLPRLSELGVPWRAELITGLPGDDLTGLKESIRVVVDELKPKTFHAYHLTVIPGTQLTELLGKFQEQHWLVRDPKTHRVLASSSFSRAELAAMLLYSSALTSLYMYLQSNAGEDRRDGSLAFQDLDQTVTRLMRGASEELVDVFVEKEGVTAQQFWRHRQEAATAAQ